MYRRRYEKRSIVFIISIISILSFTESGGITVKKIVAKCVCVFLIFGVFMACSAAAADLPVTSPFGWRSDPYNGEWKFHAGVDLGYDYGAGIPALWDGVVVLAGDSQDGYGNQVLLYHPAIDVYTRYAHCSALYVTAGENVSAGQVIAAVGSSGRSTGPHLHLEYIFRGGRWYLSICRSDAVMVKK